MPTRQELLDKCKELKLKSFTGKSKNELIKMLELNTDQPDNQPKPLRERVMNELCKLIKKDTRRKVCPNCNELGHDKNSNKCLFNIDSDNKNREKIKQYILLNEEINDYKIANELGINISKYKSLYNSIPLNDLLKKQEIKEEYLKHILDYSKYNCSLCNITLYNKRVSSRDWKEYKDICDLCWSKYDKEREQMWEDIINYRKQQKCNICGIEKKNKGQRFHYDHINMFDKKDSIYEMVSKGYDMDSIL